MVCAGCGENGFSIPIDDIASVICTTCGDEYAKLSDLKKRIFEEFGPPVS
jgi:hypothetical protein